MDINLRHAPLTLIAAVLCLIILSCQVEYEVDTSEFIVADGHQIELVASEPDVILPVAMVEDSKNRFWVVEMPGYMRDIDGNDEDLPDGRIVILSDTNQDGKVDDRKIFLDSLLNPRAVCLVYNGLLFSDGTMLKWTEINDDTPGNTVVVDSFYVVGGNIEHQPNGLLYNLDNWIYSAKSNARYRRIDGEWKKEATTFRGQWGISMDSRGRLIYNHNSAPLIGDFTIPNQMLDNPFLKLENSTGQYFTDDMRLYPIQPTSVNRGYLPNVLDSMGKVINYTSACSPHLFYGDQLQSKFQSSAFVCAPEGNLISVYSYNENTLESERLLGANEFLVSRDETFRPVNLTTGLDGSLYVVDMRKGIIQHTAYMSSYLREAIGMKGLEKINGKGRLYRISQADNVYTPKSFDGLSSKELMDLFSHKSLKVRMFAQKQLIAKNQEADFKDLLSMASSTNAPYPQIHALWTLEGMRKLNSDIILKISQNTLAPIVLEQLIILSKRLNKEDENFLDVYQKCFAQNSKNIDILLASTVGKSLNTETLWFKIADRYPNDKVISESLVSSSTHRESYFLTNIKNGKNEALKSILQATIANKKSEEVQSPILINRPFDDDRTNGLKKYKSYCTACHGLDGKGQKNVAPSLKESIIIQGESAKIASIILNGYESGKGTYQIMMPAYKEDPRLTDQDINDIISYLKSTYTDGWNSLKVEEVRTIREHSN